MSHAHAIKKQWTHTQTTHNRHVHKIDLDVFTRIKYRACVCVCHCLALVSVCAYGHEVWHVLNPDAREHDTSIWHHVQVQASSLCCKELVYPREGARAGERERARERKHVNIWTVDDIDVIFRENRENSR